MSEVVADVDLAGLIDHTLLRPDATAAEVDRLCAEATAYRFAAVCINPVFVPQVVNLLTGSGIGACTVAGFPLGANTMEVKLAEVGGALASGADEVDIVMNICAFRAGAYAVVEEELRLAKRLCGERCLKVILETCLLDPVQIETASRLAANAGADFVKTSTGFASGGATVDAVALIRQSVGPSLGVKASGGIRDRITAIAMVNAGATRIGTSNGPVLIAGGT